MATSGRGAAASAGGGPCAGRSWWPRGAAVCRPARGGDPAPACRAGAEARRWAVGGRAGVRWAGGIALCLPAGPALAHGTLAGGGGFYAGALHPFLAWEHTLALVTLGLVLGAPRPGRAALIGLALGLGAGLSFGALAVPAAPGLLAAAAVLAGALAAGLALPLSMLALGAAGVGAAVGIDTAVPVAASADPVEIAAPFAGLACGVFVIVLDAMALASLALRPPFAVALRVAGSWIAAVAIMALALGLRGAAA